MHRLADFNQVGGSLGGLFTGITLKQLGHNTTILERNPEKLLHNQGAGIVAGGDMLAWFKKYDRCQRPIEVSSQKRMYLNKDGKVVHEETMKQNMTSWDTTYFILRANYDRVESDYCELPEPVESDGKVVYLYGHKVTDVTDEDGKVRVEFDKHGDGSGSRVFDLLIVADGPSSTVRSLFLPDVKRELVGYCALRGTVPEPEVSAAAKEAFCERFTFFHADGIQILNYLIPGPNGSREPGKRLVNFVWYYNFPLDSQQFKDLMTDVDGKHHHTTLPPGKMDPKVWERMKKVAHDRMPPQFAEVISKTTQPFAQAITDVISPINHFMDGKVLLIGDALAGFRPHTVASTSQAAFDVMTLADYVDGKASFKDFVTETMQFGRLIQKRGVDMGNRSQFGKGVPLEDHIHDRNVASTPHEKEVFPDWTREELGV